MVARSPRVSTVCSKNRARRVAVQPASRVPRLSRRSRSPGRPAPSRYRPRTNLFAVQSAPIEQSRECDVPTARPRVATEIRFCSHSHPSRSLVNSLSLSNVSRETVRPAACATASIMLQHGAAPRHKAADNAAGVTPGYAGRLVKGLGSRRSAARPFRSTNPATAPKSKLGWNPKRASRVARLPTRAAGARDMAHRARRLGPLRCPPSHPAAPAKMPLSR